jgi:PIN domain nuclease of toxin-antitoxin system
MVYLLDTHVVLWALDEENRLSTQVQEIISDLDSACFVSMASIFEIAIKRKIGKLELVKSLTDYVLEIERIGLLLLPISVEHLESYHLIPLHDGHRDPFDRLILAVAYCENFKILSVDEKFDRYKQLVEVIW